MHLLTPDRILRALRKTPVLLKVALKGVDQVLAKEARDGEWCVVDMVCHMYDYEETCLQRVNLILKNEKPELPTLHNDEAAVDHNYANRDLQEALNGYLQLRAQLIELLSTLTDEQWDRTGDLRDMTAIPLREVSANIALHDVAHIEQIVTTLELLEPVG
jgi:hypothetical protein